jgi:hypothetical protein
MSEIHDLLEHFEMLKKMLVKEISKNTHEAAHRNQAND